jgi:hypothetical protein
MGVEMFLISMELVVRDTSRVGTLDIRVPIFYYTTRLANVA